ncbi:MAG: DUF4315 family protein [Butyrivibrio sp.]|nr:DUF4315 family protein [Butyrivibrio sp.]
MFARLDRLRAEHEKALKKLEDAQKKVEETAAKVKEGEATEVLSIVAEMNWTPEQLADFIKENEEKKTNASVTPGFNNKFGKTDSHESEEKRNEAI